MTDCSQGRQCNPACIVCSDVSDEEMKKQEKKRRRKQVKPKVSLFYFLMIMFFFFQRRKLTILSNVLPKPRRCPAVVTLPEDETVMYDGPQITDDEVV